MNQINQTAVMTEKRKAASRLYEMLSNVREDYVLSAIGINGDALSAGNIAEKPEDNSTTDKNNKTIKNESGRGWHHWSGILIAAASLLIISGIFWWMLPGRTVDVNSIFSEDYYKCRVSEEYKNITYIERIKPISSIPKEKLYNSEDVKTIMKDLLGASGEIRVDQTAGASIATYEEYQNGVPTGKAASVTFDSGYVQYIVLRNGKVSGADNPADFIDKKEAYEKGIAAIKEKYAEQNISLKEEYDENAITVFYNPHTEYLYYQFNVTGAVNNNWEDEMSVFTFTPMINVNDADDIEISSSLGY